MSSIRRAVVEDAHAIAAVHMRTWQVAYRGLMPGAFLEQLDVPARAQRWQRNLSSLEGDHYVTEDESGDLRGFCSLLPPQPNHGERAGIIAALYIDPGAWRGGLGAALMDVATSRARERGFTELCLWVLEGNRNARAFYESRGFRPDGAEQTEDYGGSTLRSVRYRMPL